MPINNKKKEYGAGKSKNIKANVDARKKREEAAAYKKKTDAYLKEKKAKQHKGGSRRVSNAERPGLERTTARKGDSPGVIVTGKKPANKKAYKSKGIVKTAAPKIKTSDISGGLKKAGAKEKVKASKARESQRISESNEAGVSKEKRDRLTSKSAKLRDRASKAAPGSRKAVRLAKRAKRKDERAAGTRRSGFGTAVRKVGRAAFGVAAAAGGSDAAIRKAGTTGSYYKKKAHEK